MTSQPRHTETTGRENIDACVQRIAAMTAQSPTWRLKSAAKADPRISRG
jgi:hypothetical protein